MNIVERTLGEHRIYAAALEAPAANGFMAAVVVRSLHPDGRRDRELFRDERLDDGRVWTDADEALSFALQVGAAALRAQQLVRQALVGQPGPSSRLASSGKVGSASPSN